MPNTIILRGDNFTSREDFSNVAITPGQLLGFATNDRLVPHASAGGPSGRIFALELGYVGDTVTTASASGDRIPYADCSTGTIVWAHLASGENVAKGQNLMSNGAGYLKAHTNLSYAVAQADEDADASTGIAAGGSLRFRARVI